MLTIALPADQLHRRLLTFSMVASSQHLLSMWPPAIVRAADLTRLFRLCSKDTTRPEPPLEILARPVIVKGAKRILTSPVRHPRVQAH
jgi:hypothetical protein